MRFKILLTLATAIATASSELTFQEKLDLARAHAPFTNNETIIDLDVPIADKSGKAYRRPIEGTLERWPNARIPFELAPTIDGDQELAFLQAAAHIMDNSPCIVIEPKTDADTDYVYVDRKTEPNYHTSCSAFYGYTPGSGEHYMHMGSYCFSLDISSHELLHVLGAVHEQKRPDSKQHVKILWKNIRNDGLSQFYRDAWVDDDPLPDICFFSLFPKFDKCYSGNKVVNTGLPYDTQSVMHYHYRSFTKAGKDHTMTFVDPEITEPMRGSKLSLADIYKFNEAYDCPLTTCAIGGLIWGKTSGEVDGTGSETECRWDIMVKPGQRIKATFDLFQFSDCTDKVTVKQGTLGTARKYCSTNKPPAQIITSEHELTIILSRTNLNNKFHMNWEVAEDYRTKELKASTPCFVASNPGYPNGYEANLNLEWKFFSRTCTTFTVKFVTPSEIPKSKKCVDGYVQLNAGTKTEGSYKPGKKLCGNKIKDAKLKNKFFTKNTIVFMSDEKKEGEEATGFRAEVCATCF